METLSWLLATLLISLCCISSSYAMTPPQFNVELTAFSNQLSQPTITSLHRDNDGFLWVGTQAGLNRYDGSKVITFTSSENTDNWVPESDISQIAESLDGEIWIATYGGGLAKYNSTEKTFEAIPHNPNGTNAFLKSMLISKSGKVWFGTRDAGIGMYDPKLQRYTAWLSEHTLNNIMGQPSDIFEDPLGRIWASGKNGLYVMDPQRESITLYALPATTDNSNSLITVTALEPGPSGNLWVGTSAGNILQFDIQSLSYNKYSVLSQLPGSWITDLAFSKTMLWVATDKGLTAIDLGGEGSKLFAHSNSSLSSDDISCLMYDQEIIYVGTADGLNALSSSSFEKYQSRNSQVFNDVTSFAEGRDKAVWVGTYDGVYYLANGSQLHKPFEAIYPNRNLADRRVMAMDISNNVLWVGFFQGGLQILNLEDGSYKDPILPNNTDLAVTAIAHTRDGSSWIGTYNQGLFRVRDKNVQSLYDAQNGYNQVPELSVTILLETNRDTLLAGAETELYEIDYDTGVVQELDFSFRQGNSTPIILSLSQSIDGRLWIGTKNQGLYIWSFEEKHPGKIHPEFAKGNAELPSSTIYAIEFDEKGNAWVSTTNGISKLNSAGELIKNYTTADGLQGNDFNFAASFRDSQGRIYFGGSNGYNRFDPGRKAVAMSPPPVVLTGMNIAGREPKLPVAIHKLEAVVLSYRDYFISLDFSVLDFTDPESNRYRYMLEEFDPEWIENGTRNSATYTNLPSGVYTFRVQGANSAGVWNREGTTLKIVVGPAPWWSWQAYLFYFIFLFLLVSAVKRYYDSNVIRKQAIIMTQEAHDIADRATDDLQEQLEYQDEFAKIVHAHNVSTLALISSFIAKQANFADDEITRDAILSNSSRVAALAQLEECLFYQGDQLLANLEAFTNTIIDRLLREAPLLAQSITTINEMPTRLIPVELATPLAIVIFELLQNCFQHAFENSSGGNYIQIRIEKLVSEVVSDGTMYKFSVMDNGLGIPANISIDHIETSGLAIVSSVAAKLGGTFSILDNQGTVASVTFSSSSEII